MLLDYLIDEDAQRNLAQCGWLEVAVKERRSFVVHMFHNLVHLVKLHVLLQEIARLVVVGVLLRNRLAGHRGGWLLVASTAAVKLGDVLHRLLNCPGKGEL